MNKQVPSYFKDFTCIASACEDTCCAGWGIVIDPETYARYQQVEGPFGESLRSKIVRDEDGDDVFVLRGDDCPYLNEQKLCDIYTTLGKDYLCYTCRQFPRYMEVFLDLKEMGISLSCPEAARIILRNREKTSFEVTTLDEAAEVDARIDEAVLADFLRCRALIFDGLEQDKNALGVRMTLALWLIEEVQEKIDYDMLEDIDAVLADYSDADFIEETIKEAMAYKEDEGTWYDDVRHYFATYSACEHIHAHDPLGLGQAMQYLGDDAASRQAHRQAHKAFDNYYSESMYQFKNIFVYYIFRYLMKAVYDYDLSAKIKFALLSTLMIKELAVARYREKGVFEEADMVAISYGYAKDIEHLEQNVAHLQELFEREEVYDVERIVVSLMHSF